MTRIETKLHTRSPCESLQIQITQNHFLVQTCSHCNKKMELTEGDVIYGDKWFHGICWKLTKTGEIKNV